MENELISSPCDKQHIQGFFPRGRKILVDRPVKGDTMASVKFRQRIYAAASLILLLDSLLVSLIIARVPYTKIDWDAYMSQVTGFLSGERNYGNLQGDTGPLVYPAGFLYVYSGIQYVTGGAVPPAQILFGLLYIINLGLVILIYIRIDVVPVWALVLLCLSKRVHSIFVLRLFNDCIATTLAHLSILLFQSRKWYLGLTLFSLAVSVKMNVLLYAPSLLLLLLKDLTIAGVTMALSSAAVVQVILGLPFLLEFPVAYLSRSFNLGRVFIHYWSVNFKFIPEEMFVSKQFATILLVIHLGLLFLFAKYKWCKHEKGILASCGRSLPLQSGEKSPGKETSREQTLSSDHIVTLLFTGNFIGIVCARSLHYQFYSWYFYSIPFLLWKAPYPTPFRLAIFAVIELCWNVFPSTVLSSICLQVCHIILLWGLWQARSEKPYTQSALEVGKTQ